ncbi:hypothetical protein BpHYR1_054152 [Brachionus plicatilis]|uniref:Uncharacterized protein n=1 Tax=Brachionus plicatilis TaxID=10195 RepID=A0A3M7S8U5_BRAPC|nr:hypothetical protein BpHYR1_054152 [Brachionus plicatilis]
MIFENVREKLKRTQRFVRTWNKLSKEVMAAKQARTTLVLVAKHNFAQCSMKKLYLPKDFFVNQDHDAGSIWKE